MYNHFNYINMKKRKSLWDESNVIVATPQTIQSDIENGRYDHTKITRIIYDEAHHGVGDYAYVFVAAAFPDTDSAGFTASPGEGLEEVMELLNLEKIYYRNEKHDDVKDYVQTIDDDVIWLDIPDVYWEIDEFFSLHAEACAWRITKSMFWTYLETLDEYEDIEMDSLDYDILANAYKKWKEKPFKKLDKPTKGEAAPLIGKLARAKQWVAVSQLSVLMSHLYAKELILCQDIEVLMHYIANLPKGDFKKSQRIFWMQCKKIAKKIKDNDHIRHPKIKEVVKQVVKQRNINPDSKIMVFVAYRPTSVIVSEELKEAGYMHKLILRNKKGIITGTEWHVYERPHAGPTENQLSESGLSSNGLSESGKPATTNNDSLTNNDDTENDDTAKHPHLRAFTDVYGKFKTEGDAIRLHEFYLQVGPRVYKEILDWIIKKDKDGEQLAIVGAMESAAVKWNTKKFDNTATPQQDEDKNPPGKVR